MEGFKFTLGKYKSVFQILLNYTGKTNCRAFILKKPSEICIYGLKILKYAVICIYSKNGQNMHLHMQVWK